MSLLHRLARSLPAQEGSPSSSEAGAVTAGFTVQVRSFSMSPDLPRRSLLGGAFAGLNLPSLHQTQRDLSMLAGRSESSLISPVILDCETTGLGAGTGALAFVLGLGWYCTPECLRVEQWVLRSVTAERAMLAAFLEALDRMGGSPWLVSFNGASFDLPLIRARLQRYSLSTPSWPRDHVDLVHIARRLFPKGLSDRRLGTLERTQLGVHRRDDVPGFEIPQRFWQAEGRALAPGRDPLEDVLDHNVGDVLSLPALLARLADLVRSPANPEMALGVAKLLCATGRADEALTHLEALLEPWIGGWVDRPGGDAPRRLALLAANLCRRQGRIDHAVILWRWVCREYPGDPEAHERLAKDLEHRQIRPADALVVVRGSCRPCLRRVARLQRKSAQMWTTGRPPKGPPSEL